MGIFYTWHPQGRLIWALLVWAPNTASRMDGNSPDQLAQTKDRSRLAIWERVEAWVPEKGGNKNFRIPGLGVRKYYTVGERISEGLRPQEKEPQQKKKNEGLRQSQTWWSRQFERDMECGEHEGRGRGRE